MRVRDLTFENPFYVSIMVLDLVSFSSWESQFREVVEALVKSRNMSFGQRQHELWSKTVGALVKGSRSFGKKQ